jgi:hypothetical protein
MGRCGRLPQEHYLVCGSARVDTVVGCFGRKITLIAENKRFRHSAAVK